MDLCTEDMGERQKREFQAELGEGNGFLRSWRGMGICDRGEESGKETERYQDVTVKYLRVNYTSGPCGLFKFWIWSVK